MKRGLPSGWQLRSQGIEPAVSYLPSRFDSFLESLGIDHTTAVNDLRVRAWVRRHHDHAYVPETILDAMGLRNRWDA